MKSAEQPVPLTQRGLERRIKRHLKKKVLTGAAITFPGFEHLLRNELEELQRGCVTNTSPGTVEFSGTMDLIYRANLFCRTANRILLRIDTFTARSYPELYNKLSRLHWELYCGLCPSVQIVASSRSSRLHHTDHIRETVLSALQHRMQSLSCTVTTGNHTAIRFHIRFFNDICTVSIDSSGELLYKRGIRVTTGPAPLRETTAAAMLQMVCADTYPVIADPCCGSGVLICEAMLRVSGTAPGLFRDFAFYTWPSFNKPLWDRLKNDALELRSPSKTTTFFAGDISPEAIRQVTINTQRLPQHHTLTTATSNCLCFNSTGTYGSQGLIISNLPFGKRITAEGMSTDQFYVSLGEWLRKFCRGWRVAFLVADRRFEQKTALALDTVLSFSNGGIPVRLVTGTVSE